MGTGEGCHAKSREFKEGIKHKEMVYGLEEIIITLKQSEALRRMRMSGCSYTEIAEALGIPKNAFKSFCSRNKITPVIGKTIVDSTRCRQCDEPLEQTPKRKPKRFCSNTCRQKWWNSHRAQVSKKTAMEIVCVHCGRVFKSYKHEGRKYCSHACYIADRFGGENRS